jgi:hypothetical protein
LGESVRLECQGRLCGALVEAVQAGEDVLLVDKYLRLYLRARVGDVLQVEPALFTRAKSASLVGSSVSVPVENGRLCLGTWQGIYFCEFDGPRQRQAWIQTL